MCCISPVCSCCMCLFSLVILFGCVFGFGIYKDGFLMLHNKLKYESTAHPSLSARPFLGFPPPPGSF
ncbi:hypothetical protein CISIN_1g048156mg [Citrus sinensis]|uniref:Uncharacterized protein n=1 Tax=Citrus sinensis TaxID=2711 RepID=A0A067FPE2_CITSI|nr:hypothetical protein CISIN_1g048156mg [Citrus sinensis]